MKNFKQFKEESALDARRLEMQKDTMQQRLQAKKDKKKNDMNKRMDELERELPNKTADEVIDRLKREK